VSPVNLNHQVGRRVAAQIDFVLAAYLGLTLDPVTLVWFDAASFFPTLRTPSRTNRCSEGLGSTDMASRLQSKTTRHRPHSGPFGAEQQGDNWRARALGGPPDSLCSR
jgi:hypothetical protein